MPLQLLWFDSTGMIWPGWNQGVILITPLSPLAFIWREYNPKFIPFPGTMELLSLEAVFWLQAALSPEWCNKFLPCGPLFSLQCGCKGFFLSSRSITLSNLLIWSLILVMYKLGMTCQNLCYTAYLCERVDYVTFAIFHPPICKPQTLPIFKWRRL